MTKIRRFSVQTNSGYALNDSFVFVVQWMHSYDRSRAMPEQPLTYEGTLELFRKADRRQEKTERLARRVQKQIGALGSRIGKIVEKMVEGNIVEKFRSLDYEIMQCAQNVKYEYKKLGIRGEIDLFLEDGEIAILIEVKTTLETADVRKHIKQLEEYRRCADARGDKRRFIGAVAGAVTEGEAIDVAHENGMYVIVQSGKAVEIMKTPEGFKAKEW